MNIHETLAQLKLSAGGPGSGRHPGTGSAKAPSSANMQKYHSVLTSHGFTYQGKDWYDSGNHVYSKGAPNHGEAAQKGSEAIQVSPSNGGYWSHEIGNGKSVLGDKDKEKGYSGSAKDLNKYLSSSDRLKE